MTRESWSPDKKTLNWALNIYSGDEGPLNIRTLKVKVHFYRDCALDNVQDVT